MKQSYITVTDQFCGAGGSSQGVRNFSKRFGGGVEVKLALNHWKQAIETHQHNFPDTLHDCTDVSACDPRRYPKTSILITSPECTNHSLAKGQKQVKAQIDLFNSGKVDPSAERSRATMWDVCRFAEYHQYECIVVENVVDARKWIMWDAWLKAMHLLGYKHKCVYLNSMHCHPTPQSRDRMYIVFWKKGNKAPKLDFTPIAYCEKCSKNVHAIQSWKRPDVKFGKYRQQYVYKCPVHACVVEPFYYAAFNIIDWSDPGKRIGDRKKPLSENTIRRIKHGLTKYGVKPLSVANYTPGYCRPVENEFSTLTTRDSIGLAMPLIVNTQQQTGIDCRVKPASDRFDTITTSPGLSIAMPFIIKGEHTLMEGYVKSVVEPVQTQTVRQSMGLVFPAIVELNSSGKLKSATSPTSTITAGVINHGVVQAPIIDSKNLKSFVSYNYNGDQVSAISDPLCTVTTKDRASVVTNIDELVENCYYRMLKPSEVKLAMAFDHDYVILGDGKSQVKQCGNAVTPPVMDWIIEKCVESLL